MNKLDLEFQNLLEDILKNGTKKNTRNGETISVFGRTIRHKMSDGFPLLTTKKMYMRGVIAELLWFLKGRTDLKYLLDNNCNIWNGDAYKAYKLEWMKENPPFSKNFDDILSVDEFIGKIKTDEEFAKRFGDLGPIYGHQWRKWQGWMQYKKEDGSTGFGSLWYDQIGVLIHQLKTNPDSRRLMVNAWNVAEIDKMTLPPCHYGFQVYTRELSLEERILYAIENPNVTPDQHLDWTHSLLDENNIPTRAISLMWNQRSVDTFLGLPFNIASYGLLLIILGKMTNMVPDELIGNLGDTHLYSNHVDAANEQIGRELSLEERYNWYTEKHNKNLTRSSNQFNIIEILTSNNIPTRTREPFPLPQLEINSGNENWQLLDLDEVLDTIDIDLTFKIKNYQSHPTIKAPLNN